MKKRILLAVLALSMLFVLSGCVCEHVWVDANCLTPKTCSLCEETEGEPLGHDWLPAECTLPERCSRCDETVGEALGHTWVEADCVTAKTCSVCAETEGEALGHTWVEADCVTPKTCSVCAVTEGEALGHTWEDATCVLPKTCSVCAETEGEALGHTWEEATCVLPKTCSVCAETEGEALGHTWEEATCVLPKTCSVCAETEGEALGHTWEEATCVVPKTCSVCAETEGEALGHAWEEATCVTPKTCSVCAETEGEALGHTWADATCVLPKTCSVCAETEGEALGHTWEEATCAAPETCSVCGETQGEALPHTFSRWLIKGDQMVRTCNDCQAEEAAAIDYDVYLEEALSGEWIVTYGFYQDELYYVKAGINQQNVAIYLNFLGDQKVQYFSEAVSPQYQEGVWQVEEASLQDEDEGFSISITTENDTYPLEFYDNDGIPVMYALGIDPFEILILTREEDERVAKAISEVTWAAITEDQEVYKIDFAEDYTFTGYMGSMEVAGNWHFRCVYADEYSVMADIVVTYQKDGQPCILPLEIYFNGSQNDIDAAMEYAYSIQPFNYENQIRFNRIDSYYEVDVANVQQMITDAPKMVTGIWTSVKTNDSSGETSVTESTTDFTITLLEDGTYTLNEPLAQWIGLPAEGTWLIDSVEMNYQGELDLELDFSPSGSSKYLYGYLMNGKLRFYNDSLDVEFAVMNEEELAQLQSATEEAKTQLLGDWNSLSVYDYSAEQPVLSVVTDYQLTFLDDGTFVANDAFAAAIGMETKGTWKLASVELTEYGRSKVRMLYDVVFSDGSSLYTELQDGELQLYINDMNYEFQQLTQEEVEVFLQGEKALTGSWTSVRKRLADETEVETNEYTMTFAEDGTFVINEALGALMPASSGIWSLYGFDEYGYSYHIGFDGQDSSMIYYLSQDGELEIWYHAGEDYESIYLIKD